MCNRQRSPGRKSVESGIKTNACLLAAELVSFKIDHPCLKTDTFSMPYFTTMNFLGHTKRLKADQTMISSNNYFADILRVCELKDLIWVMRFQSPYVYYYGPRQF